MCLLFVDLGSTPYSRICHLYNGSQHYGGRKLGSILHGNPQLSAFVKTTVLRFSVRPQSKYRIPP